MKTPKPLPTTSYAVLGILSFGQELSGYDIRQWTQNMRFFYWNPAQSQVYSELRRLAERDFVKAREVAQSGKPDKRLYRITEAGTAEFRRWMASDDLGTTIVMKHPVLLKLFFGHMASPESLVRHLTLFIDDVKQQLGQLAIVQEYAEIDDTMTSYQSLVADWGMHHLRAELEFAQQLLERVPAVAENSMNSSGEAS